MLHHYKQAAVWRALSRSFVQKTPEIPYRCTPLQQVTPLLNPGQEQQLCHLLTGDEAQHEVPGSHKSKITAVSEHTRSSDHSYLERIHLLPMESCQHEDLLEERPAFHVF